MPLLSTLKEPTFSGYLVNLTGLGTGLFVVVVVVVAVVAFGVAAAFVVAASVVVVACSLACFAGGT